MKFFETLPSLHIEELNLASNPINYFGFDYLSRIIREKPIPLKMLNLSNTKLTDKVGIELFSAVV